MSHETATSDSPQPPPKVHGRRSGRVLWILSVVSFGLFLRLADAVYDAGKPCFSMEPDFSQALQSISGPGFERAMRSVSVPGDSALWFAPMVGVVCLFLLIGRDWRTATILLGIVGVGQVLKVGVKHLIARPRPTSEVVNVLAGVNEIYSFPSGHTVLYTVFFGFLWYLTITRLKKPVLRWPFLGLLTFMVLAISVSRIYLGAHWLSDVLGGYLLGGAILAAGIGLERAWNFKQAPIRNGPN